MLSRKTHCKRGHERTPENLLTDGHCKICRALPERKAWQKTYDARPERMAARRVYIYAYRTTPAGRAYTKAQSADPKVKARLRAYNLSLEGKMGKRRWNYHFTPANELRFQMITNCDFCGLPFNGETRNIDHDHACCPTGGRSCGKCLRGFVHRFCNLYWIPSLEEFERRGGGTDPRLADYRARFPRRNNVKI
jgi:hypothetical protein